MLGYRGHRQTASPSSRLRVLVCAVCCRKVEDMRLENKEMSQALSSKEAGIRGVQQQLEEKSSECSVLSRQLQQTVDDAQRQV